MSRETERDGTAAVASAPRPSWLVAFFTSSRLTLWLLGVLTVAMAVATLIPQNAPDKAYREVFGRLLGAVIAKTNLRSVYGSWWFVGAFALLTVNLLACSAQQAGRLLRRSDGPTRLLAWAPVLVHLGMALVLIGAAWGRMPRNTYRARAPLRPGETFAVRVPDGAFGLRLLEAGTERDAQNRASDYWAKLEVLEEGNVVRSTRVRMNHPLRYHGVSAVLERVEAKYGVQVTTRQTTGVIPVVLGPDGQVDMMATVTRLDDPPWIVFLHDFREKDERGRIHPMAHVFIDKSGGISHNWRELGWVGPEGLDSDGVHFRSVGMESGATLLLDRDVGIPIVYAGFLVISMGTILALGGSRRSVLAEERK